MSIDRTPRDCRLCDNFAGIGEDCRAGVLTGIREEDVASGSCPSYKEKVTTIELCDAGCNGGKDCCRSADAMQRIINPPVVGDFAAPVLKTEPGTLWEENAAVRLDSLCPACAHPKHLGTVCGHEVDVAVNGDGHVEPVRCPCHEEAYKASGGKVKGFHLLPWDALAEVAWVFQCGAEKYAPDSWRQAKDAAIEYENAMFRHIKAAKGGKIYDEDFLKRGRKVRHVAQIAWNAIAVLALTPEE